MNEPPIKSRNYLRGALTIFVIVILVIIVVTTADYWLRFA
jgi:hypothetical protein